jgi:hypothetical protein
MGSAAERAVADPVARSGAPGAGAVVGVRETAAIEREAAAADALGQADLEALELGDSMVDPRGPPLGEARPVTAGRRAIRRQLGELRPDLIERQPDALGEDEERRLGRVATVGRTRRRSSGCGLHLSSSARRT